MDKAPGTDIGELGFDPGAFATALMTPEEFRQVFLNGSLYERISIRTSDDPIKTYYSFDTEPEDEFDEYTHPSIRITLTGKTS